MILPIIAYGNPVLKKVTQEIDQTYPNIKELIDNMFETMHKARGIGLAAPQVGLSIRLFIIDTTPLAKEKDNEHIEDFKQVFINPEILEKDGEEWTYNEGCLSIPEIREDIVRKSQVSIRYYDENFNLCTNKFTDLVGRIILHEYDHLEGILFTDRLSSLRKRLLKRKLTDISKGNIEVHYEMSFPLKKTKQSIVI